MSKAERTRQNILAKAFDLIYENGYQATSIDRIVDTTEVTKGAFYYHFSNKEEMGIAVINEIIFPRIKEGLITPLVNYEKPVEGIYQTIRTFMMNISDIQLKNGCPTNNMIQEMAPLNDRFKKALFSIMQRWESALVEQLKQAADDQQVGGDQNLHEVAKFIIASYEGARNMGKLHRSRAYYQAYLRQLKAYLHQL